MAMTVVLTAAIGYGFVAGLDMQRVHSQRRASADRVEAMERRITEVLRGATLSDDETDLTTYFVGGDTGTVGLTASSAAAASGGLTFTTTAPGVPSAARFSEDDWETQQAARGPVGGVAEVSLSTTPVGMDAGDRAGLFERIQRPADGDPSQGGTESLLAPGVAEIVFEFWDGTQWLTAWDTLTGERRLPAAVRVTYVLNSEENRQEAAATERTFIVAIPASDVDALEPATGGGATP